jgi:hypothetical protein
MEIVIDWLVVTGVTVALAWVVNSGIPLLGKLFGQAWELSELVKKAVAFSASVGLVYFWRPPLDLPDPALDPFLFVGALLGQAEVVFKAAQEVYDHIWKGIILKGAARLFGTS